MKNIQLKQNNFQKPEIGNYVKCTVEVRKDGETIFHNIYDGQVIEVIEDSQSLAYVRLNGFARLIPIEKVERVLIGTIGGDNA